MIFLIRLHIRNIIFTTESSFLKIFQHFSNIFTQAEKFPFETEKIKNSILTSLKAYFNDIKVFMSLDIFKKVKLIISEVKIEF